MRQPCTLAASNGRPDLTALPVLSSPQPWNSLHRRHRQNGRHWLQLTVGGPLHRARRRSATVSHMLTEEFSRAPQGLDELLRRRRSGEREFHWADLYDSNVLGVDLRDCDLHGASLGVARIADTDLSGSTLTFADFQKRSCNEFGSLTPILVERDSKAPCFATQI